MSKDPSPARPPDVAPNPATEDRREFCKKALAAGIGGAATLVPAAGALWMALDPLRTRAGGGGRVIRVATLSAVPEDGSPRKFPVIATRTDVWNKLPPAPIGAVYLRRTGPSAVQAFNVVCPHAGCFVEYVPGDKRYLCPCHNSAFTLDGQRGEASSPAARGLDELKAEIRNGQEIWVEFQNFLTGHAQKIPQA